MNPNVRRIASLAGAALTIAAVLWFAMKLKEHASLFASLGQMQLLHIAGASTLCVLPALFTGLAWFTIVDSMRPGTIGIRAALSMVCLTQIAKYLPGNVAHHAGRAALAHKAGLDFGTVVFSMFLETLVVIAVSTLIAMMAIVALGREVLEFLPGLPPWWAFGLLLSALAVAPLVARGSFGWLAGRWARQRGLMAPELKVPPLQAFAAASGLAGLNFLTLGGVLLYLAHSVLNADSASLLLLTGVFAVAWTVGFMTPGAPAGIGLREVVLVAGLAPFYGQEGAVGLSAILRLVTTLGDGITFLVGALLAAPDIRKQANV